MGQQETMRARFDMSCFENNEINMRNTAVIIASILVFAALVYGGVLQDRMRRKARRPGASIFSVGFVLRSLATREAFLFLLLTLGIAAFAGSLIAMDGAGYFAR